VQRDFLYYCVAISNKDVFFFSKVERVKQVLSVGLAPVGGGRIQGKTAGE
jgi:hypothetical protein